MARKRVNKRKLSKKTQKKGAHGAISKLFKLFAISLQFSILFLIAFALYAAVAFIIQLFNTKHTGTNIHSEKIPIASNQVSFIVGTKNSKSIPLTVYRTIVNADKLLILDFHEFPSYEKGKSFYNLLVALQKKKPGLSIFVIANDFERNFNDTYPVKFAALHKAGINVIFADTSIPRTYRWLYSPLAYTLAAVAPSNMSTRLKRSIGKSSRRNVIISHGDRGIQALTGSFSLLKNTGHLEMGINLTNSAALPLLKSELFLIREFLNEDETNGFAKGGKDAINRDVESCLKNALSSKFPLLGNTAFQYLSEGEIKKRLNAMLSSVERGDNVDIIVGTLNESSIIKAIRFADLIGANVRLLLDKNSSTSDGEPGLPNILSAKELNDNSKKIQVRWLEGHTIQSSFIHIYNQATAKDQTLILTSPISPEYIGGYNLAGACYVEGEIKDSQKLVTLFNTYSNNNATRSIYSKRFDKYPLPQTKLYYLKLKKLFGKIFPF